MPVFKARYCCGASTPKFIAFILLVLLAVRLLSMGAYPLGSTTEPRYAEIARKMLETGNWVTPWFDHGVPFWGKPPLSFWGSAATMGLFGVNEFAARLAPLLAALGTAALFWAWPRAHRHGPNVFPMAAMVVMFSTVIGFIASAAVMTDMFMTFSTTLCMVAFWRAVNDVTARTPWRWWFFVGIALGLLAKGPVAMVITGLALGLWVLFSGQWRTVWACLPWLRGTVLTMVLALPWYGLAELRTPGFLQYFIVGEHVQRFLVSGWTGDLYGAGHAEVRGLIWWFGFGGFLPWSPVALVSAWLAWRHSAQKPLSHIDINFDSKECLYLLAWIASPLLFFTTARNILEAYVLPGLPAFALLTALLMLAATQRSAWLAQGWWLAWICPVLFVGWLSLSPDPELRSQRALLRHWPANSTLVYLGVRPLSANFYAHGLAKVASSAADIQQWMASAEPLTLVMSDASYEALPPQDKAAWKVLATHAGFTMLHR